MTTQCHIWGCALLCVLPVAVGQPAQESAALELCRRLVDESREVDRLLRTISDRDSGQKIAAELRGKMDFLQSGAARLGQMPLENAESVRRLEQLMRDMMHITQGYMPVVQRLVEVNAYGADDLLHLFQFYKMSAPDAGAAVQLNESPLARSYTEWCDGIDDALYLLRRVQDAATAADFTAGEINAVISRVEQQARLAERRQAGLSPQQMESELLPLERLNRLRAELREELRRVAKADYYANGQMKPLLDALLAAARA